MAETARREVIDDDVLAGMIKLIEDGYFLDNPPELQRLILATYSELTKGEPVTRTNMSGVTCLDTGHIGRLLELMPESAIEFDTSGDITGFIGLSIWPSRHELKVAGRTLYTWCAFDALFLPEALDRQATIRSVCPQTSAEIEIELAPRRILAADPGDVVMSIVSPHKDDYRGDLQDAFCCHVNFFRDRGAFDLWADNKAHVQSVGLDQAFDLARMRNRRRFPDIARIAAN